jgi:hypothetical protein
LNFLAFIGKYPRFNELAYLPGDMIIIAFSILQQLHNNGYRAVYCYNRDGARIVVLRRDGEIFTLIQSESETVLRSEILEITLERGLSTISVSDNSTAFDYSVHFSQLNSILASAL